MKRVKRHLIFKKRVNAAGVEFFGIKAMSLDGMRNYFSAAEDAKTFRGAVTKVNKAYEMRYAACNRSYEYIVDLGEVKYDGILDITKNSKEELVEELRCFGGHRIASIIEERV